MDSELGTLQRRHSIPSAPSDNAVNLSGAKIPFSPEFTGNIGLAYDIKLGDLTLTPRAITHIRMRPRRRCGTRPWRRASKRAT